MQTQEIQQPETAIDLSTLTDAHIAQYNDYANFLTYNITEDFTWFVSCPSKIICLFTGNQRGKTAMVAYQYVMRILGMHPIKEKNIWPTDKIRTFRFASETLPNDDASEVRNTQYPEFKKWLPHSLIKKDITIRKPVMTIKSPLGGPDIFVEFVSFNQDVQAMAGVQRKGTWIDENSGQDFFEEQIPRLLAADGDLIMSYTPTPGSTGWEFDTLYERASKIYRTPNVIWRIFNRTGERYKRLEERESNFDISVFMSATDDNPTLEKKTINGLFQMYDDEDVIDARRFGLFRQLSGRIFKDYSDKVHRIIGRQYFPDGMTHSYKHFRSIDFHQHVPWACVWMSVSPQDEIFVWDEFNPSPEKMVTHEIARIIARKSLDYHFAANLIDPLASSKQTNTGMSAIDDLNRLFYQFKHENLGTGGYWTGWDTKSTRGRDEFRKRLKNSILVGRPFNNEIIKDGRKLRLPTIWITDNCVNIIQCLKSWRWEEWANRNMLQTKDEKETPTQRWSHFPMAIECLLKDPRVTMSRFRTEPYRERAPKRYFTNANV